VQDIVPFGNNLVFRYLFGWMMPPKISLLKLTQGKTVKAMYEKYHCMQDMLLPLNALTESLKFFDKEFQVQRAATIAVDDNCFIVNIVPSVH